jgi:hypothetical protein
MFEPALKSRRMTLWSHGMKRAIVAALFVVLAACGDNSKPQADKGTPAPEATKELSAPVAEKSAPEASARTPSPAAAKVFFILPEDGARVHSPVIGVEGMVIVPAGTDEPHSGHHHLLIDPSTTTTRPSPTRRTDTTASAD